MSQALRGVMGILSVLMLFSGAARAEEALFAMQCPQDWERVETSKNQVSCLAPEEGPEDLYRENVAVQVIENVDPAMSPEKYAEGSYMASRDTIDSFALLESRPGDVGGWPAHEIIYTSYMRDYGLELQHRQTYLLQDGRAYWITYSAQRDKFEESLPAADRARDTFRVL